MTTKMATKIGRKMKRMTTYPRRGVMVNHVGDDVDMKMKNITTNIKY